MTDLEDPLFVANCHSAYIILSMIKMIVSRDERDRTIDVVCLYMGLLELMLLLEVSLKVESEKQIGYLDIRMLP